jgi:hypothetical protein
LRHHHDDEIVVGMEHADLRRLVHDGVVLAACDGRAALDGVLHNTKTTVQALGWGSAR